MRKLVHRLQLNALFAAVAAARGALGLAARLWPQRVAPALTWPAPGGAAAVGVRDVELLDGTRAEPRQPGRTRRLMARLWYPAADTAGCVQRPLQTPEECAALAAGSISLLPPVLLRHLGATLSASWAGAPAEDGAHPLLVFSHGMGGMVGQNTHLCEHLASHGYVVMSLAHPHAAAATLYRDGSRVLLHPQLREELAGNLELADAAGELRRSNGLEQRYRATRRYSGMEPLRSENLLWAADISAAITLLQQAKAPGAADLAAICDFSRIGVFGMSFGGSASASAAQVDARIGAAVNLDGGQADPALFDCALRAPMLMVHSGALHVADGGAFNDFHYQPCAQAGLGDRVQRVRVRAAGHLSFTDLAAYGSPTLRKLLGTGGVGGERMLELTAELVRRFFDRQLRGDDGAFPDALAQRWPELEFQDMSAIRNWALARPSSPSIAAGTA